MSEGRLWATLNSSFVLLVMGFVLTTLAGGLLSYWFDRLAWSRDTRFEICRQELELRRAEEVELLRTRLARGEDYLQALSDLIGLRVFRALRVREAPLSDERWDAYLDVVEQWNAELLGHEGRVRQFLGDEMARQLNSYETDFDPVEPTSLHGFFFTAHQALLDLRQCRRTECEDRGALRARAADQLRMLNLEADGFVDAATRRFHADAVAEVSFSADSVWRSCSPSD